STIELEFSKSVYATTLEIYFSGPSLGYFEIEKVELVKENGSSETVWQGTNTTCTLQIAFAQKTYLTNKARITTKNGSWGCVDAVKLVGYTSTNPVPACTKNSDCGTDGWTGSPTCSNGNVYQNYTTYTCNSPGTENAQCTNTTTPQQKETCTNGCTNGTCNFSKPQSTGAVKVAGRKLFVNGSEFKAKSIGYAPIPIGQNPEWGYDVTVHPELTARDFSLLRAMGANAIRTWGKVNSQAFLDDAWNNGNQPLMVIMGYWMGDNIDYQDNSARQAIIADFSAYVNKYKNHPAVLVWAIGNEENYFYANGNNQKHAAYFSLVNEMAKKAYEIEGSAYHPVMAIALEMPGQMNTVGNVAGGADDASIPYVDIWGINHYPGQTFGNFFNTFAGKTAKPLLVTEYGIDALNNATKTEYEQTQADWDAALWREIASAQVAIGGSLMAYSDEWWKDRAGVVDAHDFGGYVTTSHPDGYSNEEWWGIVRAEKSASGPDKVTPRKGYYALQQEFKLQGTHYECINQQCVQLQGPGTNQCTTNTECTAQPNNCPNNMTGYWQFENNANDTTGKNNATTNGNPTYVQGKIGKAINLNGTTDYLSINDNQAQKPGQLTIEAWANLATTSGWNTIIMKTTQASWTDGYGMSYSTADKSIRFFINNWQNPIAKTSIQTNTWTHIAATYDQKQLKIYTNGTLTGTTAYIQPIKHSNSPLYIGKGTGGYNWKGQLDEIATYNTALTATEIQQHYQNSLQGKNYCENT
ncbi:MAG: hypothetical protein NTW59_02460, partial [Candidatus Diapherotrites archaeon]|nr:hypothetical protein [Candidatus Diapherotrites archaeon]